MSLEECPSCRQTTLTWDGRTRAYLCLSHRCRAAFDGDYNRVNKERLEALEPAEAVGRLAPLIKIPFPPSRDPSASWSEGFVRGCRFLEQPETAVLLPVEPGLWMVNKRHAYFRSRLIPTLTLDEEDEVDEERDLMADQREMPWEGPYTFGRALAAFTWDMAKGAAQALLLRGYLYSQAVDPGFYEGEAIALPFADKANALDVMMLLSSVGLEADFIAMTEPVRFMIMAHHKGEGGVLGALERARYPVVNLHSSITSARRDDGTEVD
jgi:hypothetical protein